MSFKINVKLSSPIGSILADKTYEFDKELQAKDIFDMCLTMMDKYSFETYDEYLATVETISKILQGYEYSIRPVGRKEVNKITWLKKGKQVLEEELK